MRLLSPSEDFSSKTLSALEGGLARLFYLASLKDGDGHYRHWGLARTYGESVASEIGSLAHREALREVLRTPIPELVRELKKWGNSPRRGVEYLLESGEEGEYLLPPGCTKAAATHLRSVLFALRAPAVVRRWRVSTRPTA